MGKISFIVDDSQEIEFHSALNRLGVKLDDFFIKSIERAINESSHLNATDSASPCDGDLNLNRLMLSEHKTTLLNFDNSEWDDVPDVSRCEHLLGGLRKVKNEPSMTTMDMSISQMFSDVLTSDKGMVKLIRNDGADFIFNAINIIDVLKCEKEYRTDNVYETISFIKDTCSNSKPEYAVIVLGGRYKGQGNILVYKNYDYVFQKIKEAKAIAKSIDEKKNGVFF